MSRAVTLDQAVGSFAAPISSERSGALDAARFAAAIAIVWLHTARSPWGVALTDLSRFAVPFFVASLAMLSYQSARKNGEREFLAWSKKRALRLYLPFIAWSAMYLVFKGVKAVAFPGQPNDWPGASAFWTGTFYHLWFLPFALVVSLFCGAMASVVRGGRFEILLGGVALVGSAALAICVEIPSSGAAAHELAIAAIPAALAGLAWGAWRTWDESSRKRLDWRPWLVMFAFALGCIAAFGRSIGLETAAGFALARACYQAPWPAAWRRGAEFGGLAMGVYLSHLLFVKVAESLAGALRVSPSIALDAATFLFAATASVCLTFAVSRARYAKWLVT